MSEEAGSRMSHALTVLREVMADRRHRTSPAVTFMTEGLADEATTELAWNVFEGIDSATPEDSATDWADAPPDASEDVDSQ